MKSAQSWSKIFPKPEEGDDDCVAVSRHLSFDLLIEGYFHGFFPWPHEGVDGFPWFSPDPRAVLFFDELHIPRSLAKTFRKSAGHWRVTRNQAFSRVIEECKLAYRPGQGGTWISAEMQAQYQALHREGYAHSLEVWEGSELIAGIYGVYAGFAFSAESMFHKCTGASKFAVIELCKALQARGLTFLDIQMLTPHLELLGAREISRSDFLKFRPRSLLTALEFS
ncbi:MAG: leucyl/phenylalanyl-tRNA--protein transferase [Proteobacteria bacterium]|nr:MAG: leucyl/phenylalanyl-tRNA--protein transferase [Pseudomonadota bacterium]